MCVCVCIYLSVCRSLDLEAIEKRATAPAERKLKAAEDVAVIAPAAQDQAGRAGVDAQSVHSASSFFLSQIGEDNPFAEDNPFDDNDPQLQGDDILRSEFVSDIKSQIERYTTFDIRQIMTSEIWKKATQQERVEIFWTNPLVRKKLPFMVFIARRHVGIPATSAMVERIFSVCSLFTDRRGRNLVLDSTLFKQILVHFAARADKF